MGFSFRKPKEVRDAPVARPGEGAIGPEDGEAALESLAAVLRSFGSTAFDIADTDAPSIRQAFEHWAQHLLVAAPVPESKSQEEPGRRQWRALRQFVASHRKQESAFVVRALNDFREVIWAVIGNVNRAAAQDRQHGVVAGEQLSRLRVALDGNDTEALKRQATETVSVIGTALEAQGRRQAQQLAEFGASIQKLGQQLETAKREGTLDPLTRIHNRACFDEFVQRTTEASALFGQSAVLFMVDVDHFKTINDKFGHPGGDAVIKAVADCLARTFPRRGDLVARYGGDEFAVVIRDTSHADGRMLAERLVNAVRAIRVGPEGPQRLTISLGLAPFVATDSPESWLARADKALYQAKADGRDRWAEAGSP